MIFSAMKTGFFATLALCLCVACGNRQENTATECFAFTDDYGVRCMVPKNPRRIVSLSPAVTEIVFAVGAGDMLVGRTEFCDYPPQVEEIENIGGISNLNAEKVISLKPDLVIGGSMIPEKTSKLIGKAGIPVACVIEKENFEGLFENITKIGLLTNHVPEAEKLNDSLKDRLSEVAFDVATDTPSVYYVVGYGKSGNFTAGGNTFINDMFRKAGTRNIAENITGWEFGLEALLSADPDYVIIRKEDAENFVRTEPYDRLSAVRNHRVIAVESAYLDLQVPRNIEGLIFIRNATHPEK